MTSEKRVAGQDAVSQRDGATMRCPFCGSIDTEEMAIFGSQLSTAQRYCRSCHTPFERLTRAASETAAPVNKRE